MPAFPGFEAFYNLSDPLATRPYRAKLHFEQDLFRLARAELVWRDPIKATWAQGSALPSDVVWTTYGAPVIVHARVLALFERNRFAGWTHTPVELHSKAGGISHDYFSLGISGRCGTVDLARSSIELHEYPGGWGASLLGHYFVPDTWDGSDLFMHEPDPHGRISSERFVTSAVRRALIKAKIRNVEMTALPAVSVSTANYTIGLKYLLPADFESRLAAAYSRAGVPRPDWV